MSSNWLRNVGCRAPILVAVVENLRYFPCLNTKKPDYLKEGLLEFLQSGPKNLDECVVEGGIVLKRSGFKGPFNSDDFRMRVFEKLHQLTRSGYLTKDRSVKPPVFLAN